jgi:hypothetical protein
VGFNQVLDPYPLRAEYYLFINLDHFITYCIDCAKINFVADIEKICL